MGLKKASGVFLDDELPWRGGEAEEPAEEAFLVDGVDLHRGSLGEQALVLLAEGVELGFDGLALLNDPSEAVLGRHEVMTDEERGKQ